MLNAIWAFMILIGILYGSLTGNMMELSNAALDSAKEAVSLCITMLGVMAFWVGMMEIAGESGLIERMTNGLKPFIRFMFPKIPDGHKSLEYIATNIVANILGLGWACTPAGLKAMEELSRLEAERGNPEYQPSAKTEPKGVELAESGKKAGRSASDEMCTFLIINISSLQLIPVNMIAYRGQYGSVNPAGIIAPAIVATACSTLVAVVYCKVMGKRQGY